MSRIDDLISKYCPNGVEYKKLSAVVSQNTFKQLGASELEMLKTDSGDVKLLPSSSNYDWWSTKEKCIEHLCQGEVITLGRARYANIKYHKGYFVSSNNIVMTSKNPSLLSVKFLLHFIKHNSKNFYVETSTYPKFDKKTFDDFFIPVPPLAVQEEIVNILDSFTLLEAELEAELEARKQQYEYYRNNLFKFKEGECEWKKIGEVAHYPKARIKSEMLTVNTYVGVENLVKNKGGKTISSSVPEGAAIEFLPQDILIGNIRPYLKKIWLSDCQGGTNGDVVCIRVLDRNEIIPKYLYYILASDAFFDYDNNHAKGGKMPRGDKNAILAYEIPIPSMEEQSRIVSILDRFETLTTDLQSGLPAEIEARRQQYEHYRNKLLTFERR